MDIKSVTSGLSAYLNGPTQGSSMQQAQQVQPTQQELQAQQAADDQQAPKPVINVDGQKTGSVINVTA